MLKLKHKLKSKRKFPPGNYYATIGDVKLRKVGPDNVLTMTFNKERPMEKQEPKRKLPRTHKELEELLAKTKFNAETVAFARGRAVELTTCDAKLKSLRESELLSRKKHYELAIQALSQLASANAQIAKELGFATNNLIRGQG